MEDPRKDRYDHQTIEAKWQKAWAGTKLDVTDIESAKRPYYNLMMFPYPSAEGLHVGNMYAFTGSDIHGRFKRMQGWDVFEPIGLDGFGIHSENFALKIGRHPMDHALVTEKHFYDQLHQIGAMFDFTRTLETYDPKYYRWTQWLFIQLFKAGLAYRGKAMVNFCPSCKTVLSDEQVVDGKCERCGNEVEKRALEQWFFRITAYAEKLLGNIPKLEWSEVVKTAQTKWIGKKEGISISYPVVTEDGEKVGEVSCFTTRPDTNFGATFVVIAPEHEFVQKILFFLSSRAKRGDPCLAGRQVYNKDCFSLVTARDRNDIEAYVASSKQKSDQERVAEGKKKTGVFTGLYCINPLNNYKMPLYISDFVLVGFGTGVVVGVPGHDKRDFQFAKAFGLPVKRVVVGTDGDTSSIIKEEQVDEGEGTIVNSEFLDGLKTGEAMQTMMDYLEKKGWGKRVSTYHLRDWLISRQRYWGPPIPMIYCKHCAKEGRSFKLEDRAWKIGVEDRKSTIEKNSDLSSTIHPQPLSSIIDHPVSMPGWYPVPEEQLPVLLPRIDDYKPSSDGIAPLSKHKEFFDVVCPSCGKQAVRETDVSDTFLDSSWYFLKYPSVGLEDRASKIGVEDRRLKIEKSDDLSSTAHLQLPPSTFDHLVSHQYLPWDPAITRRWLPVDMYTGGAEHSVLHLLYSRYITMVLHDLGHLDFDEPFTKFFAHGLIVKDGAKMSKSKGNVVNPDEYIPKYGADSLRLYLMFMGPLSMGGDFSDTGMEGMSRWVGRVWRVILRSLENPELARSKGVARVEGSPSSARSIAHCHIDLIKTNQRCLCGQKTEANTQSIRGARTSDGGKPVTGPQENIAATSETVIRLLHKTIAKLTDDMEKRRYNTAIASLMEFTNAVVEAGGALGTEELKKYICLLAPFAPHISEEAWNRLHGREIYTDPGDSIHRQPWPSYDPTFVKDEEATIVVQINGKTRGTMTIAHHDATNQEIVVAEIKREEKFANYLTGPIKKTIFVPGKLVNFVL